MNVQPARYSLATRDPLQTNIGSIDMKCDISDALQELSEGRRAGKNEHVGPGRIRTNVPRMNSASIDETIKLGALAARRQIPPKYYRTDRKVRENSRSLLDVNGLIRTALALDRWLQQRANSPI